MISAFVFMTISRVLVFASFADDFLFSRRSRFFSPLAFGYMSRKAGF
jgi:hypothetical protein